MGRVLLIENSERILGGGQLSLLDLAAGLKRHRAVIAYPGPGAAQEAARRRGLETCLCPLPPLRPWALGAVLGAVGACGGTATRLGAGLLHANGSRAMFYAGLAAWRHGLPVLWHVRVTQSDGLWDRFLARLARRIVVPSRAVARRFAWAADKVEVVYNGIDAAVVSAAQRQQLRCELGGGLLIVGIGRLSPEKDHETFLKAAAMVAAACPQARFAIVGGDPDPQQRRLRALKGLVAELGMGDRVAFVGSRPDAAQIAAAADVLVHCAHSEAFGRVLVEAMAATTPVVATAVGGIPEVIGDEEAGVLVPAGDATAVAAAVVSLIEDPARRQRIGERGRRRAARFSVAAHVRAVEGIYDRLLGEGT